MEKETKDIQRALDGFSTNLSGELSSKYKSLRNALEAYATAHSEKELDSIGTGSSDMVIAEKESVQNGFIELFRKLDSKSLEAQSELEFKKKDAELNLIYQALQKNKDLDMEVAAAPSRKGIRKTQRKWIRYRDAWLAFALLKFPTINTYSLNAALTADRISKLRRITAE